MRLVGPNGEQVGIVKIDQALSLAAEADLDLVEVAPMAKPPVAKLMDFGKYKYEAAMKAREARKNQVNTVIKEIKLRPKIDPHDYGTKKGHVERFLNGGDKVKVTIMFRGREQSRPELGYRLLQRLAQDVVELGVVESAPKQDGRNMIMVLAPTKKKAQAMAEQRRRRDEAGKSSAASHDSEPMDDEFGIGEALAQAAVEASAAAQAPAVVTAPVVEVAPVDHDVPVAEPVATVAEPASEPVRSAPVAVPAPVSAPVAAPVAPAVKAPAVKAPAKAAPKAPGTPKPVAPRPQAPVKAAAPAPPKPATKATPRVPRKAPSA